MTTRRVTIPIGAVLDLGGIAKGRAADLVCGWLADRCDATIVVDVGGDLRVRNAASGEAVTVHVVDPHDAHRSLLSWNVSNGGVATSSTLKRCWRHVDGRRVHHLVDPATGAPTDGPLQVSVLAGSAADAEVLTKVAMVGGVDAVRGWVSGSIQVAVVDEARRAILVRDGLMRPLVGSLR